MGRLQKGEKNLLMNQIIKKDINQIIIKSVIAMDGDHEKKQFSYPKREEVIEQIKALDDDIEHVSLNLIKCHFDATEKEVEKTFPQFKFIKVKNYNPGSFEVVFQMKIDAINFIRNCFDRKILGRRFFIKMGRQHKQVVQDWACVGFVPRKFNQHKKNEHHKGPHHKRQQNQKKGEQKGEKTEGGERPARQERKQRHPYPQQHKQGQQSKKQEVKIVATQAAKVQKTEIVQKLQKEEKKPQPVAKQEKKAETKPVEQKKEEAKRKEEKTQGTKNEGKQTESKKQKQPKVVEEKKTDDDGWIQVGGTKGKKR